MSFCNNLLLSKNKISYRNNIYDCNCCKCRTSNCQCSCYCKCHIQSILLPINKKNSLDNFYTEDGIKGKGKKIINHNSANNVINLCKNFESKENENINNLNKDDIINKNYQKINLIPKVKQKFKNKSSTNSSIIKQKLLNNKKSQAEFNNLLRNISDDNLNKNINIDKSDKENKNISNNALFFDNTNYNTFYNFSKLKNQTDRNNYNSKYKNTNNNISPSNSNNYLLYFMTNENFYNHKTKKIENKEINKINNKKKKEQKNDNNIINNYISESKYSKREKNNDIRDILRKYENKKINEINSSFTNMKISNFNFNYIKNGLNNKENEKLIKIYEKKIQQLEKKLIEANEKIDHLTKISIKNKSEIIKLKEDLNQKNIKLNSKIKHTYNNILGRNNDSLIINLPENFQTLKMDKDSSFIDDNSFNKTNINNMNNNYLLQEQNNSCINECKIYKKKKSSKIYKKTKRINRTLSQTNLNQIYTIENINIKLNKNIQKENKTINNNKIIYTIYPLSTVQKLLSFDLSLKYFSFKSINTTNFDDFNKNYLDSFCQEESQYNSIILFHENVLYTVIGKNSDIFYKLDPFQNTFNKICNLKNNHANGVLVNHKDTILCLSGKFNKKVEVYYKDKKAWEEMNEMNIERSFFSACIIQDKFLFCLFGYNTPTNKYLDSIEFCDISNLNKENDKCNWKYLKYKKYNLINMNICGFVSMNYKNEKIIIFGGINGLEKKPVDKFYQIILDKNKNFKENGETFIEETNRDANNIYKNKCYYFINNLVKLEENNINDENEKDYYAGFDNNFNAHVIEMKDKLIHDVYFFNK